MRNCLKKILGISIGGLILISSLSCCGNEKDVNSSANDTDIQSTEKNQHEALTISRFNNLITEDFIDAFHEVYPEVELEIISYAGINGSGYAQYSLEHGEIPDIYITSQTFAKDAQKEYLLDLSNYEFINHYSNALLDSLDVDGNIYLLPSGYQLTGIYYNKTILQENGWSVPNSFHELVALSEEMEAKGYHTMGHGMALDGFPFNYFFNIGNTMYFGTPEGTQWKEDFPQGKAKAVGNSELKKTAEYFNQWVEHGFISTEHMGVEQFFEGECVFFLCLGLNEYTHTTKSGKTYEFGTIPWLSEDGSSNMLTRSVSRYMGINQALAEKGKEQKLEDALKLLDYISTTEGQRALMSSSNEYMLSLNEAVLSEDSPYKEIEALVDQGRTVPLLYVGWERQIVPIAQDIKQLIAQEINVDELIEAFDDTNDALLHGVSEDLYAVAEKTLTIEETAKLVAIAEGKAAGADCVLISLNQYHGDNLENAQGLAWHLYQGDINTEQINLIRPRSSTISVLEMAGTEIRAMRDAGFDLDGNGNPYEYLLFIKGDIELDDNSVYKVAVSTGELTSEKLSGAEEIEISPSEAIRNYLKELKTVRTETILWEIE